MTQTQISRLKVTVAPNMTLHLNARLCNDGCNAKVDAELNDPSLLGMLETEMDCFLEETDGRIKPGRVCGVTNITGIKEAEIDFNT